MDAQYLPLIFAFTHFPAKIAKIKGARKFRGLQYLDVVRLDGFLVLFIVV